ncbi:MAG: efflux RND transporter periplasmic adaptor subunit [Sphingopyxis sp.]|nr:efflux RND transporter periplasmic adaptor subunit [Sphingopyxis sp.]
MMTETKTDKLDEFLGVRPEPVWRRYGRWILAGLALLLLLFIVSRCSGSDAATEYVTAEVRRGDIAVNVVATGNLAPTNQVDVGSEISGIVDRVLVEVNDRVIKGQPLAIIDTDRLRDAVSRSRATLAANDAAVARERASLVEAQAQLDRLEEVYRLSGGQVPSRTELDSQRAAVARARASLRSAEANVVAARAQLSSDATQVERAVIRAPVTGVVLKRSVDPGQTVQASFNTPSLFIIAEDLRRMQLEVSVDEADVGLVNVGQQASFTVDAWPGRVFPAVIERVDLGSENLSGGNNSAAANSAASNVVSYLASLSLTNDALILRPGMTATATIATSGERNVLVVPNAALRFTSPEGAAAPPKRGFQFRPPNSGQGTKVTREREIGEGSEQRIYVLGTDNTIEPVPVTTGQTDGRDTAVRSNELKAGMKVVTGVKAQAGE